MLTWTSGALLTGVPAPCLRILAFPSTKICPQRAIHKVARKSVGLQKEERREKRSAREGTFFVYYLHISKKSSTFAHFCVQRQNKTRNKLILRYEEDINPLYGSDDVFGRC